MIMMANDVWGYMEPKFSWHLSYSWAKIPEKTSTRKTYPTRDRTQARWVKGNDVTPQPERFNPREMIWTQVKDFVAENNKTVNQSIFLMYPSYADNIKSIIVHCNHFNSCSSWEMRGILLGVPYRCLLLVSSQYILQSCLFFNWYATREVSSTLLVEDVFESEL